MDGDKSTLAPVFFYWREGVSDHSPPRINASRIVLCNCKEGRKHTIKLQKVLEK